MTCIIFKIGSIYTEGNTLFKKIQHFSLLVFNKFDHLLQQNPLRPHLWTWHRKQNHWRRSWKHYKRWNVNSKQNTEQTNQQQPHRTTASSHTKRQQSLFAKQQKISNKQKTFQQSYTSGKKVKYQKWTNKKNTAFCCHIKLVQKPSSAEPPDKSLNKVIDLFECHMIWFTASQWMCSRGKCQQAALWERDSSNQSINALKALTLHTSQRWPLQGFSSNVCVLCLWAGTWRQWEGKTLQQKQACRGTGIRTKDTVGVSQNSHFTMINIHSFKITSKLLGIYPLWKKRKQHFHLNVSDISTDCPRN